jgi:hypothetical protein
MTNYCKDVFDETSNHYSKDHAAEDDQKERTESSCRHDCRDELQ